MKPKFKCPECGHFLTVDQDRAGEVGVCTNCGRKITIPGLPELGRLASGQSWSRFSQIACIGGLGVLILCCGFGPLRPNFREDGVRQLCKNNMHQLGLAIANYYAQKGAYPPAITYDKAGRPMHSWRVLILPYMEKSDLRRKYRMNEPWDSPHNRELISQMPEDFACPGDRDDIAKGLTGYLAVTGKGTVMDSSTRVSENDVTDGLANTLLLIESHSKRVPWTQPQDIDVGVVPLEVGLTKTISSGHLGDAVAVFADGHATFVTEDYSPKLLRALATRNGHEDVSWP